MRVSPSAGIAARRWWRAPASAPAASPARITAGRKSMPAGRRHSPFAEGFAGGGGRLVAVGRSIAEMRRQAESAGMLLDHSVVLYLVSPNTILIEQVDHVEIVQAYPGPGGPDTTTVVLALYTPAPVTSDAARTHFQANFDLLLEVTENEDFRLGEQIQRGVHPPGHDTIVYCRTHPVLD